jgi:hypothetical protein
MSSFHLWIARHVYSFRARQALISNGQQTLGAALRGLNRSASGQNLSMAVFRHGARDRGLPQRQLGAHGLD